MSTGWIRDYSQIRTADKRLGFATAYYQAATGSDKRFDLLWGDCVQVYGTNDDRLQVHARGFEGWADEDHVRDDALLEVYFINVCQGDGVLVKTPDLNKKGSGAGMLSTQARRQILLETPNVCRRGLRPGQHAYGRQRDHVRHHARGGRRLDDPHF